jgi:arylsulfatase A-like enzyme
VSLPTLAEAVRERGYWTAGVATNALMFRPAGFDRGFDAWREVGDEEKTSLARGGAATNRAVARVLAERPSDRFFLYAHYMDVHDYQREERSYAASVAMADAAIGELVEMLEAPGERDLESSELFVSEQGYQTYRSGRFKSYRQRGGDLVLVDLENDAGEQHDVASLHPEVALGHAARLDELTRHLAVESARPTELSERDEGRLRSLGYLE